LKEAKQLFDNGLIDEIDYAKEKTAILDDHEHMAPWTRHGVYH